jgi:hypothetical protein
LYSYVGADPLRFSDPLGLVKWSGTNFTAGAGAFTGEFFDLVSECKCGYRTTARVRSAGLSYGRGLTFAGSFVELTDPFSCPDANLLAGDYFKVSAGAAGIFGVQFNFLILGAASSPGQFGAQFGFDASAGVSMGKSSVVWSFNTPCNECEK